MAYAEDMKKGLVVPNTADGTVTDAVENDSVVSEENEAKELAELKQQINTNKGKEVVQEPSVGLSPKLTSVDKSDSEVDAKDNSEAPVESKAEIKKKYNMVPQYRLNQYARRLKAQEKEHNEEIKQLKENHALLLKQLQPNAGQPQMLTVEAFEKHTEAQQKQFERMRQTDEALVWLTNEQKSVEELLGSKLDDGFHDDLASIIKEQGWLNEDPRLSVPAALEIWKKENMQEIKDTVSPPPSGEDTPTEPVQVKSPEQIRNEQKDKATPITKTKKIVPAKSAADYTQDELDDMSMEQLEKLAGRSNRTMSNRVY